MIFIGKEGDFVREEVVKIDKKVWQWLVRQVNLIDDNTDNIAHRVRCAGRKE